MIKLKFIKDLSNAQVNGDKVYWKVEASGDMSVEWIDR